TERVRPAVDIFHRRRWPPPGDRQERETRHARQRRRRSVEDTGTSRADMTLLDRFRAQPRQKHADPAVRLAFVQEIPITERDLLAEIARGDEDPRVRRAAAAKLMNPQALAEIARDDVDEGVRTQANTMLRDIAVEAFEGVEEPESLAAVDAIIDAKALALIAKTAPH